MKGTTPKKGRATPAAPQNRKERVDLGNGVRAVEPSLPLSERMSAAQLRYRTYRKATRFWRRTFGGQVVIDQRVVMTHQNDAQAQLRIDGRRVFDLVHFRLGGVEDVTTIAQALGMKRGRVRLILAKGLSS